MVPDLCKSPGSFIGRCFDPARYFFGRHIRPYMAKIIELLSRIRFSFPRLVSNREGFASQYPVHHFIKAFFNEMVAALGHGIHGVFRLDGKTFYLDDTAGIHSSLHVVTGDAVLLFIIVNSKVGTTGTGIFGAARVEIDGRDRSAFEQAGRVDP